MLMGSSMVAAMMVIAPSLAQAQAVAANGVESVTVTGYAASLEKSTDAKRESLGFSDTVFAEDIGKIPRHQSGRIVESHSRHYHSARSLTAQAPMSRSAASAPTLPRFCSTAPGGYLLDRPTNSSNAIAKSI